MLKKNYLYGLAVSLIIFSLPAQKVFAADHLDSPSVKVAGGAFLDITDVYVFTSPSDSNNVVIAVDVFSPEGATTPPLFDTNGLYEIFIDSNADLKPDHTIIGTFKNTDGGGQEFSFDGVPGLNSSVSGSVSTGPAATVIERGGAKAFAGLRDDPFFFDFEGFTAFVAAPCLPVAGLRCAGGGAPVNFFSGFNVAAIVLEFPKTAISGITSSNAGTIKVWAKTFKKND